MWKTIIGPVIALFNKIGDMLPDYKERKDEKREKIKARLKSELYKDPRDDDVIMELIDKL